MNPRKIRRMRRYAKLAAMVGITFQMGTCDFDQLATAIAPIVDLLSRIGARVFSDALFFIFDNILVRLTV